jgi:hypothetical protein
MLCQKCGLNEAEVHRETMVFRQKIEEHMCPMCAGVGLRAKLPTLRQAPRSLDIPLIRVDLSGSRPSELRIPNEIQVRTLADQLSIKPFMLIATLMKVGVYVSVSQMLDFATAARICECFGVKALPEKGEVQ